jgi:hypothetical protein
MHISKDNAHKGENGTRAPPSFDPRTYGFPLEEVAEGVRRFTYTIP